MIYVMSDLHGQYEKYKEMLTKIQFSPEDTLYILGDVVDRGEDGIKILLDMMDRWNIIPLLGNHEHIAYMVLKKLNVEITQENVDTHLDYETLELLQGWMENGGRPTMKQFSSLSLDDRHRILEYFEEFSLYEEVTVGEDEFLLVHAGLGNFQADKPLEDYSIEELIWDRCDYEKQFFENTYLITGHTPTVFVCGEEYRGRIYRANNHIAIDCGAAFPEDGGRLGCICLDTMEEFYV